MTQNETVFTFFDDSNPGNEWLYVLRKITQSDLLLLKEITITSVLINLDEP